MKDVAFSLTTPENMLVFCNKNKYLVTAVSFLTDTIIAVLT